MRCMLVYENMDAGKMGIPEAWLGAVAGLLHELELQALFVVPQQGLQIGPFLRVAVEVD